ncbi:MAG TPA: GNAT family N-acetyltransferase [Hyphomicrobiaceae bacterium]|nr:GNAT family N-acetyltransferase [Hyphomicrobiaceae bacterium]
MSALMSLRAGGWPAAAGAREAALTLPPAFAALTTFAIVADRAGFDALEPEWNDLFARAGRDTHVFQTFNWNWHWANHYLSAAPKAAKPALAIVTGRRRGRLVLLWPLVIARHGGLSVVRWMGEPVSQYGDVLIEDAPDKAAVLMQSWRFLASELGATAISLRKVRADANVAPLLASLGLEQVDGAVAPYLDLASAPDFAAYERRYSQKARKNRRRLLRRLEEQGAVVVTRHAGGSEARDAARAAIALKRAWTHTTARLAPALADPRFGAFFADVADGGSRPAGCAVTMLRCQDAVAGIAIDVTCRGHRAAHIIVHDPALKHLSPGTLLLREWIRAASAERIATFDLLAPAYAYKGDWADASMPVSDYAGGFSWRGSLYARLYLGWLRPRLKGALEALPRLTREWERWRQSGKAQAASADPELPLQGG